MQPIFFGLPSAAELYDEPQRAILAALDANLVLAGRALQARHPDLDDSPGEALPLLAQAVLSSALSLHEILSSYDDVARHTRRQDSDDPERIGDDGIGIPF